MIRDFIDCPSRVFIPWAKKKHSKLLPQAIAEAKALRDLPSRAAWLRRAYAMPDELSWDIFMELCHRDNVTSLLLIRDAWNMGWYLHLDIPIGIKLSPNLDTVKEIQHQSRIGLYRTWRENLGHWLRAHELAAKKDGRQFAILMDGEAIPPEQLQAQVLACWPGVVPPPQKEVDRILARIVGVAIGLTGAPPTDWCHLLADGLSFPQGEASVPNNTLREIANLTGVTLVGMLATLREAGWEAVSPGHDERMLGDPPHMRLK